MDQVLLGLTFPQRGEFGTCTFIIICFIETYFCHWDRLTLCPPTPELMLWRRSASDEATVQSPPGQGLGQEDTAARGRLSCDCVFFSEILKCLHCYNQAHCPPLPPWPWLSNSTSEREHRPLHHYWNNNKFTKCYSSSHPFISKHISFISSVIT